jgi:hypothetical protein
MPLGGGEQGTGSISRHQVGVASAGDYLSMVDHDHAVSREDGRQPENIQAARRVLADVSSSAPTLILLMPGQTSAQDVARLSPLCFNHI